MKSKKIIRLDHRIEEHIDAASQLHEELLPDSPIPGLGRCFMRNFYYRRLIEDGLVICDLYKHNDKYVGFLSYTKYPFSFMRDGRKKHFFYLIYILLTSLLSRPSRIRILIEMLRVSSKRNPNADDAGTGEFISFGVLGPYRHILDEETGLRISELLFMNGACFFKKEGYKKILLPILKKNRKILVLYEYYGASFTEDTSDKTGFSDAFIGIYDLTKENDRIRQV